ncbi:MAG: hypothetical protein AB7P03_12500 [Kofleriaceae bacterium]
MFLLSSRSLGTATAAAGALVLAACSQPDQLTDLRPAGPPEVLTVMVMNDPADLMVEKATYCKLDDDKRPVEVGLIDLTLVTVCDPDPAVGAEMVTDAVPYAWYVRVVFDELLDPAIEMLTPVPPSTGDCYASDPTVRPVCVGSIKAQQPVTLMCGGVPVAYDGYYSPGGNYVTWPVGPGLVIVPDDPTAIPTGTECQLTLSQNIKDKDGIVVPMDQRGPFTFKIAPFSLESTAPASILPGNTLPKIAPEAPVTLTFNTVVDPTSLTANEVRIFKGVDPTTCQGGTEVPEANVVLFQMLDGSPPDGEVADDHSIMIADGTATNANPTPADPEAMGLMFDAMTAYRIELVNATASDIAGGSGSVVLQTIDDDNGDPQPSTLCFQTNMATP